MVCMDCGGSGCDRCKFTGSVDITTCPLEVITPDIWEIIEYADLYKKGLPPVSGGALDQSHAFVQACGYIWDEQEYWKNKKGLNIWAGMM